MGMRRNSELERSVEQFKDALREARDNASGSSPVQDKGPESLPQDLKRITLMEDQLRAFQEKLMNAEQAKKDAESEVRRLSLMGDVEAPAPTPKAVSGGPAPASPSADDKKRIAELEKDWPMLEVGVSWSS